MELEPNDRKDKAKHDPQSGAEVSAGGSVIVGVTMLPECSKLLENHLNGHHRLWGEISRSKAKHDLHRKPTGR